MKIIKYTISYEVNTGTEREPNMQPVYQEQSVPFSSENEEFARNASYDGQYTIEDNGQPEPEPSREEKLEAEVAELKKALDLLLSGVTE